MQESIRFRKRKHGFLRPVLHISAALIVGQYFLAEANVAAASENGALKLALSLETITPSDAHVGFRVTLENTGGEPVRILKEFTPLPIFFAFSIERQDGTLIPVPGAGKISFLQGSMKYVILDRDQFFGVRLRVEDIVRGGLPEGAYKMSVVYHNQYGDDCFKGSIGSNTLEFTVGPSP